MSRRSFFLSAAALTLAAIAILWRVTVGGHSLSGGDLINHYIPYKALIVEELRHGEFPHWNPMTFSGRPLQGDIQAGVFYPPNWLFLALEPARAFDWLTAAHFVWMAWGALLFFRLVFQDAGAAAIAAAVFSFSGFFASQLLSGIVLFVFAGSWLPWMLYLCERGLRWGLPIGDGRLPNVDCRLPIEKTAAMESRDGGRLGIWLLLGAAGAMQLLAGAPQIAFYSWLLLGVYALAGVLWLHRRRGGGEVDRAHQMHGMDDVDNVDGMDGVDGAPCPQGSHGPSTSAAAVTPAPLSSIGNRQSAIGNHPFGISLAGWLAWAGLIAAGLVALSLTAVQWAPTREFMALSFDRGRGASWDFVTDGSFRFSWILTYLAPFLFGHPADEAMYWGSDIGYWEFNGFAGVLALALAVAGLTALRRKGDPQARRLAVFALVCLALWAALAPGKYSPIFRLAYLLIPGFDRFRVPARWVLAYQLALAVLAGLGWKRIAERESRGARAAAMTALGLMAAAGLALTAFEPIIAPSMAESRGFGGLLANPDAASALTAAFQRGGLRLALSAGAALAVLISLRRKRLGAPAAACALLAVLADVGSFGVSMAQTTPRKDFAKQFYPDTDARRAVAQRLAPTERWTWDDSIFDWNVDQNQLELNPNRPILNGLPTARGYDPLNSLRYGQYSNALAGRDVDSPPRAFMFLERIAAPRLLSLLNVKVVLSYQSLEPLGYRLAQAFPFGLRVYENPDAIGPAFLAAPDLSGRLDLSDLSDLSDPLPVFSRLLSPPYDWRRRAVVEEPNPFASTPAMDNLPAKVETIERGYGRWRFRVSAPQASVLVLGQSYYPGWQAAVDGKARTTVPADWALTGVFLEPGEHDVAFAYHPKAFDRGAAVSVATIVLWIVIFFGAMARDQRRRHAGA